MITLEEYLTPNEIHLLTELEPEVLDINESDIYNHILILRKYNLKPATIKTILQTDAHFLISNPLEIEEMLAFISQYSDDLDNILESFPEILKYSVEELLEGVPKSEVPTMDIERCTSEFILNR